MTLQISALNFWAILVCIISNMVIGALWYSPLLFGNQWLKLVGKKAEDINKAEANKSMMFGFIPAIVFILSLAILLKFANATTIIDGFIMGTLVSVGFIGMSAMNQILFEGRAFKLVLLDVGYPLVALNIAAIILVLWQ